MESLKQIADFDQLRVPLALLQLLVPARLLVVGANGTGQEGNRAAARLPLNLLDAGCKRPIYKSLKNKKQFKLKKITFLAISNLIFI
jgi:hypothetical protein